MPDIPDPLQPSGREANLLDKSESELNRLSAELDDLISGARDFGDISRELSGLFTRGTQESAALGFGDFNTRINQGRQSGFSDADLADEFGMDLSTFKRAANFAGRHGDAQREGARLRQESAEARAANNNAVADRLEQEAQEQFLLAGQFTGQANQILAQTATSTTTFTPNQEAIDEFRGRLDEQLQFQQGQTAIARDISTRQSELALEELEFLGSDEFKEVQETNRQIAATANERIQRAQAGELDLDEEAPGFVQRTESLFRKLKKRGDITGTDLDTAEGTTSSGVQALSAFRKEKDLLTNQIKHGILSGSAALSQGFQGAIASASNLATSTGLAFKGAFSGAANAVPGLNQALGFAQGGFQSTAPFLSGFGGSSQGFLGISQPFGQIRQAQFQQGIANAGLSSQRRSDFFNLGGQLGGAGLIALSSRKFKKNIKPLSKREENRVLQLVKKGNIYTYDYKWEPEGKRPNHIGVIAEEAPHPIATPDRKGQDLGNTINLLLTSVRALDRKVDRKFALARRVA